MVSPELRNCRRASGKSRFKGELDEVDIWSRVLGAEEVWVLQLHGLPANEP